MTDMDARDEAAAADFEQGWSGERIGLLGVLRVLRCLMGYRCG